MSSIQARSAAAFAAHQQPAPAVASIICCDSVASDVFNSDLSPKSKRPIADGLIDAIAALRAAGIGPREVRMTTAMRDKLRAELPAGLDCNRIDGLRIVIDDRAVSSTPHQTRA